MTRPFPPERRFAEYLAQLVDSAESDERAHRGGKRPAEARAELAELRRGLGKEPGEVAEVARYVFPHVPMNAGDREVRAYFQVAALFASHRGSWNREDAERASNLGRSFWMFANNEENPGAERRFVALLNAHTEELDRHLRHAVSLLKTKEIPIDWAQLLRDIQEWTYGDRRVQLAWASARWGSGPARDGEDRATGGSTGGQDLGPQAGATLT